MDYHSLVPVLIEPLRIWDVASGKVVRILAGHGETVEGLSIAEENNFVISGAWGGQVILWDWQEGVKLRVTVLAG
jgi:WD40 repeat protein